MGFAFATSACFCCKRLINYNPVRVPSIRDNFDIRQPICRDCMERGNEIRISKGLDPHPTPNDAYEPCEESEINF